MKPIGDQTEGSMKTFISLALLSILVSGCSLFQVEKGNYEIPAALEIQTKETARFSKDKIDGFNAYASAAVQAAGDPDDAEILRTAAEAFEIELKKLADATENTHEAVRKLRRGE